MKITSKIIIISITVINRKKIVIISLKINHKTNIVKIPGMMIIMKTLIVNCFTNIKAKIL